MKKAQGTKGLIIAIVLILLVVGYYYYLSHREVSKTEEVTVSEAQDLLLRDLDRNYPPTPKEVVKYFFDITKCLYCPRQMWKLWHLRFRTYTMMN